MGDDFLFEFTEAELCGQPELEDAEQVLEAKMIKIRSKHLYHRLTSERMLEDVLPLTVSPGECYHVISGGDVDSFSYLMWILRMQKVKHLLCSTWCIAKVDIQEYLRQITLGRIGRLDFYVGEILPGSFPEEYRELGEVCRDSGGRIAVFRNHSKVMAGLGEKFDFAIESSANINTNPRTEQTVVTIDSGVAKFYFDFYGGIVSFDKEWR
ncbi:MAG: hypothetical protein IJU70_11870 [Lentisphaeria bacterium]|nr:hypothetical protein [Lentisphaeria bacterium]